MVHCPSCEYANAERTLLCAACGDFLPGGLGPHDLPSPEAVAAFSSAVEVWPSDALPATDRRAVISPAKSAAPKTSASASESVAQAASATIPATDRADRPPPPPPEQPVRPRLVVLRGMRIGAEYPIYEGRNTAGRFADKPVDIDLVSQESPEQIWCSRRHAVFALEEGALTVEDLNSLNGTWVNGARILAGQPRQLQPGDVVQIGTVQMKLVVG